MGNTHLMKMKKRLKKDHPHIHGEYSDNLKRFDRCVGSPPHTWGILKNKPPIVAGNRITPTYMGNTRLVLLCITVIKDHPHIHGEYCVKTAQS